MMFSRQIHAEKVNRFIAAEGGKIIIAAYKDGSGLLERRPWSGTDTAAYPYDMQLVKRLL
jgi:hypothetical protein